MTLLNGGLSIRLCTIQVLRLGSRLLLRAGWWLVCWCWSYGSIYVIDDIGIRLRCRTGIRLRCRRVLSTLVCFTCHTVSTVYDTVITLPIEQRVRAWWGWWLRVVC